MNLQEFRKMYKGNIKELRENNHVERKELAEALGCSVEYLRQIEEEPDNDKDVSLKFLFRLACYFEIEAYELFL